MAKLETTFTPMTFSELWAPYEIYKNEHEAQEQDYLKTLEAIKSLEDLSNSPIEEDKELYEQYSAYKQGILDNLDKLRTSGLSHSIRQDLTDAKARYLSEFAPYEDKLKMRAGLLNKQSEFVMSHPNNMLITDYSSTPLSEINSQSTFLGRDLDVLEKSAAQHALAQYTKDGRITELDLQEFKDMYDYDNLTEEQQAMIDNSLNNAKTLAATTYTDQAVQRKSQNIQSEIAKLNLEMTRRKNIEDAKEHEINMKALNDGKLPPGRTSSGNTTQKTLTHTTADGTTIKYTEHEDEDGNKYIRIKNRLDGNGIEIDADEVIPLEDGKLTREILEGAYLGNNKRVGNYTVTNNGTINAKVVDGDKYKTVNEPKEVVSALINESDYTKYSVLYNTINSTYGRSLTTVNSGVKVENDYLMKFFREWLQRAGTANSSSSTRAFTFNYNDGEHIIGYKIETYVENNKTGIKITKTSEVPSAATNAS